MAVRAWSDLGAQYATERSSSKATAMIASAEVSQTELDDVEEAILKVEDLLKEVGALAGEDNPSAEDILNMEVDELDSDDDMSPGRYSCHPSEGGFSTGGLSPKGQQFCGTGNRVG